MKDDLSARAMALVGWFAFTAIVLTFTSFAGDVVARREALIKAPASINAASSTVWDARAALAAEEAVSLSLWQVLTSVLGLGLVGWTLHATRRAVAEASEATLAARDAVLAAREATAVQNRAYLAHVQFTIGTAINSTYDGVADDWFIFRGRFQNVGKTPALQCQTYIHWAVGKINEPPEFHFEGNNPIPIMPTVMVDTAVAHVPMNLMHELFGDPQRRLFAYTTTRYDDAFGGQGWQTTLCMSLEIGLDPALWATHPEVFGSFVRFSSVGGYGTAT